MKSTLLIEQQGFMSAGATIDYRHEEWDSIFYSWLLSYWCLFILLLISLWIPILIYTLWICLESTDSSRSPWSYSPGACEHFRLQLELAVNKFQMSILPSKEYWELTGHLCLTKTLIFARLWLFSKVMICPTKKRGNGIYNCHKMNKQGTLTVHIGTFAAHSHSRKYSIP
jgi:hypothetical protein